MNALPKRLPHTTLKTGAEVLVGSLYLYLARLAKWNETNPGLTRRLLQAARNDGKGQFSSADRDELKKNNFIGSIEKDGVSVLMTDAVRIIIASLREEPNGTLSIHNPVPAGSEGEHVAELGLNPPEGVQI